MGRGVAAACLSLLICHGWGLAQLPPSAPPAPVAEAAGPPLDGAPVGESVGEVIHTGRGGLLAKMDSIIPGCQVWAGAEYLMYFMNGSRVPVPLVTSGVSTNPVSGALGETGTQILLGDQRFNTGTNHGARVRLGFDIVESGFGIEAIGFMLNQQTTTVGFPNASQSPSVLGIPFISQELNTEAIALVTAPGTVEGDISYKLRTNLSGWEANLGYACDLGVMDWGYVGYRYLNLTEGLFMTSNFRALDAGAVSFLGVGLPAGSTGTITDSFRTRNEFQGGQFGGVKRIVYRNVAFEGRAGVAFGNTRQRVEINGFSSADGGTPVQGGLFAQPSNSGETVRNQFSVVPEVNLSIFVQLCESVVVYGGYNFLYWNNLSRPGYEIDRRVNVSQAPFGPTFNATAQPPQPAVLLHRSQDLIVHGLNAGLAVQF